MPRRTVDAVSIDALRQGWPEPVLTGRYSFATREVDGIMQGVYAAVELGTFGLVEMDRRRRLQIRIDDVPVMTAQRRGEPHLVMAPHAVLGLRQRVARQPPATASLTDPTWYDVIDYRHGSSIGALCSAGGLVRPARTDIYDPANRLLGRMTQPPLGFLAHLPVLGAVARPVLGDSHYVFTVGHQRVATIRKVWRLWAYEYEVDVSQAAGLLDPRLILACALDRFHHLSGY
jgi:hypothetical protein